MEWRPSFTTGQTKDRKRLIAPTGGVRRFSLLKVTSEAACTIAAVIDWESATSALAHRMIHPGPCSDPCSRAEACTRLPTCALSVAQKKLDEAIPPPRLDRSDSPRTFADSTEGIGLDNCEQWGRLVRPGLVPPGQPLAGTTELFSRACVQS